MQPNFCRSAATVAACGVGRRRMAGIYAAPGTSESGTLRSTGGRTCPAPGWVPGISAASATGSSGRGQIFTAPNGAGKLKPWKTEKLIALPAHPDCQDFRFLPPPHAAPEDLARWPGVGRSERQLCARNRTFRIG